MGELKITDPDVLAKSQKDVHPIAIYTGNSENSVVGVVLMVSAKELEEVDRYEVSDYQRV